MCDGVCVCVCVCERETMVYIVPLFQVYLCDKGLHSYIISGSCVCDNGLHSSIISGVFV